MHHHVDAMDLDALRFRGCLKHTLGVDRVPYHWGRLVLPARWGFKKCNFFLEVEIESCICSTVFVTTSYFNFGWAFGFTWILRFGCVGRCLERIQRRFMVSYDVSIIDQVCEVWSCRERNRLLNSQVTSTPIRNTYWCWRCIRSTYYFKTLFWVSLHFQISSHLYTAKESWLTQFTVLPCLFYLDSLEVQDRMKFYLLSYTSVWGC